jgi:DNA-binding MarR family transcriptional regulator
VSPDPAGPAASFTRAESLGYQVNLLARLMAQLLAERIAEHGVVPGQFAQLLALYEQDGLTATELCRAVRIEPGTMTKTLQRMERDGLVERRPDPRDGRAIRIHLTDRARELEPLLKATAARVNAAVIGELSDRRAAEFMHTVVHLVANAERLLEPAPLP